MSPLSESILNREMPMGQSDGSNSLPEVPYSSRLEFVSNDKNHTVSQIPEANSSLIIKGVP